MEQRPIDNASRGLTKEETRSRVTEVEHLPRGWPTTPQPLEGDSTFTIVTNGIVDVCSIVLSALFLTFAVLVHYYNDTETNLNPGISKALLNASIYGPTVFPIVFASIFGRATHAILLWRLGRVNGERLGVLDTLAASTSFTNSITTQFRLRSINLLGLGLLIIWALSPVGGQATLRQITVGEKTTAEPAHFMSLQGSGPLTWTSIAPLRSQAIYNFKAIFQSSVLAPRVIKDSPRDTWGNVKIPIIETYEREDAVDGDGWFSANKQSSDRYSSLIGVPIQFNSSSFVDYKFNIDSSYLFLDCPTLDKNRSYEEIRTIQIETENAALESNGTETNATGPAAAFEYSAMGSGSAIIYTQDVTNETIRPLNDLEALKPVDFSYFAPDQGIGMLQCQLKTSYVEVQVHCPTSSTCAAIKVRRSRLNHPPPAYTRLDEGMKMGTQRTNWRYFNEQFQMSWTALPSLPTVQDNYIREPYTPTALISKNATQESKEVYATRLGQLFNAYWTSMQLYQNITGVNDIAPGSIGKGLNFTDSDFTFNNVSQYWMLKGTASTRTEILVAHEGWVAALCIASIALLIVSFLPPVMRRLNHSPSLEINLSDLLTRHNPYISLSATGTSIEAADRTRLLRNLRVQFGDVEKHSDVGVLAVGTPVLGTRDIGKVQKGRFYE